MMPKPKEPPKQKGLNSSEKAAVRLASRTAIEETFDKLEVQLLVHKWIAGNNRYAKDCVKKLTRDGVNVKSGHLSRYIAAASVLHCLDGWAFLGRAVDCHARGDLDSSRHLAYYAELRAAMSLLSSEGIGIFNNKHYIVDSTANCNVLSTKSTHTIVWLALQYWATLKRSSRMLGHVVGAYGISLDEWVRGFNIGAVSPVGLRWFRDWGLDLKRLATDRDARNEASYRPTRLHARPNLSQSDTSTFMRELWQTFEPAESSRYLQLDRYLVRISLEQIFYAVKGKTPAQAPTEFRAAISNCVRSMSLQNPAPAEAFLTRASDAGDPTVVVRSGGTHDASSPEHHLEVISRAGLLLRIATGSCCELVMKSGFERNQLRFWWSSIGEQLGLWEQGSAPDNAADLWADVNDAIEDNIAFDQRPPAQRTFLTWRNQQAPQISSLGVCERIGLWGLGI
jgi:hypothetical protein